jgi:homocitrate synthase NifV
MAKSFPTILDIAGTSASVARRIPMQGIYADRAMLDKAPPRLVDLTLRDGEQAAGLRFPRGRRIEIARALGELGLREIEAGIPAMGRESEEDFSEIAEALPELRVFAWNRVRASDIEASARAGARCVHVALPTSDLMLRGKLGWERERALDELASALELCRRLSLEVAVGAEDASRTDGAFLLRVYGTAVEGGASRLRYADTLGTQDPFTVFELMSYLSPMFDVPLEYHAHNDLGLATANALAALRAGAWASVTVGGIGERAGNASLEQVACARALLHEADSGIELRGLAELNGLVASLSGRPIPPDKPIVGAMAFAHESGIHVDGLLKDPAAYEFLRPELVGRSRRIVPGSYSGQAALRHCAASLGFDLAEEELPRLASLVREAWSGGAPSDPWIAFGDILRGGF